MEHQSQCELVIHISTGKSKVPISLPALVLRSAWLWSKLTSCEVLRDQGALSRPLSFCMYFATLTALRLNAKHPRFPPQAFLIVVPLVLLQGDVTRVKDVYSVGPA